MFLCVPRIFMYLYIFLNFPFFFDCAGESLIVCLRDCVSGKSAAEERRIHIYIYLYIHTQGCLLRHGDCYHPPSGKKEENTHKHSPHPFSFSSLFSILHLLCSALSLSLSVSLTKAAVSSKMRPRTEGMQMKSLLVD